MAAAEITATPARPRRPCRWSARIWCAALVIGAAGCTGELGIVPSVVVVRDSAGVRIVRNRAGDRGAAPEWRLSEEPSLVIGSAAGPEPHQLYRVNGARVLEDARIVIANAGTAELRFFGADGHHVGAVGRKGSGPGEFSYMSWLGSGADGTLLVWDSSLDRLSSFSQTGEFVGSVQIPFGGAFSAVRLDGVLSDGSLVLRRTVHVVDLRGADGMRRDPEQILRYHPDTRTLDTLAVVPGSERFVLSVDRAWGATGVLFGRNGHVAVGRDRIYYGDSDRFIIHDMDASGLMELIFSHHTHDVHVSVAAVERARDMFPARPVAGPEPPLPIQRLREARIARTPAREALPAFGPLAIADDGHVWIRRGVFPWQETSRWEIFDSTGVRIGSVDLPTDLNPTHIGPDFLVGKVRDDLGVEYVVRHSFAIGDGRP